MAWQWLVVALEILRSQRHCLHSALSDDNLWVVISNCVAAGPVCIEQEHLVRVLVPMEICLCDDGYLEVPRYAVPIDRLKLWLINVVDLDLVFSELAAEHAGLDSEWILADVGVVARGVVHDFLWLADGHNSVFVNESGLLYARSSRVTSKFSFVFRSKFGLDSLL